MDTFIKLIELQVVIVILIDLSGFMDSVKKLLSRWLGVKVLRLKPFDCSLCMFHHISLLFLFFEDLNLFNYLCLCLLAIFTPVTAEIIKAIINIIYKILNFINYGREKK